MAYDPPSLDEMKRNAQLFLDNALRISGEMSPDAVAHLIEQNLIGTGAPAAQAKEIAERTVKENSRRFLSRTPGDAPVAMAIEFRPAGKGIGGGDLTHAIKNGEVVATIKSGIGGLYYVAPERPGASMGSFKVCHSEGEAKDYVAQTFSRPTVNLVALSRALATGHFEK